MGIATIRNRQMINTTTLTVTKNMTGDSPEETAMLKRMEQEAIAYLKSFHWCPPIDEVYFGCGVGGVVAVFLFHFCQPVQSDEWLWVVEGDLPPAYLVRDQARDPASALELYCQLMEDWAQAVLAGHSMTNLFPVQSEPTRDNANNLIKRLVFIRTRLLPDWRNQLQAAGSGRGAKASGIKQNQESKTLHLNK